MLAPISWLKEYTPIKLSLKDLMWKMTEVGITCETYEKIGNEIVLDAEITPNRPDWLSMVGMAREIAVIHNTKVKLPNLPEIKNPQMNLPINIVSKTKLVGRYTAITIKGIHVKPSPKWMQERLKLVGLRPINNLVDITNYVMLEFGVPIHVFDYDKFKNQTLKIRLSDEGEKFKSVDGLSYRLPKNALVIEDNKRVIDLCGIKGGKNTEIDDNTKNIFIHLPIYSPQLIRKTSQTLKLASDASYIYERGADAGGTMDSLKRCVDLTLDLAGGKIASKIIDIKSEDLPERKVELDLNRVEEVLGISVPKQKVKSILSSLDLSPKLSANKARCMIPTHRKDIQQEEDLLEEIARVIGYNAFPKTLPVGDLPTTTAPYSSKHKFHKMLKDYMTSCGFTEVMTYSLISAGLIEKAQLDLGSHIKLANPTSLEYEYMQMSLIPSLILASKQNAQNPLKLFELGKVYLGEPGNTEEPFKLSVVARKVKYPDLKGCVDLMLDRLGIENTTIKPSAVKKGTWHPTKSGVIEKGNDIIGTFGEIHPKTLHGFDIKETILGFELDLDILEKLSTEKYFAPVPKFPAQIEDVTFEIPFGVSVGDVIRSIKSSSKYVSCVLFVDKFNNSFTFRIHYQHPQKTFKDKEVEKLRNAIIKKVKVKHKAKIK